MTPSEKEQWRAKNNFLKNEFAKYSVNNSKNSNTATDNTKGYLWKYKGKKPGQNYKHNFKNTFLLKSASSTDKI